MMGTLFDAGGIAAGGLLAAILLAGTGAVADAQSAPERSEVTVTLKGVISVAELAKSQENLEALQRRPVEQPLHGRPNRPTLDSLPLAPEPNVGVFGGIAPAFASVKGFVGLFGGENAKVIGGELEPPDQGLAVNNNVAVEHINDMIQVFNATTGAPLSGPVANSKFFLVPSGFSVTDTQVFFDPTTSRWFLDIIMSQNSTNTMDFALAISKTSNPLGSYFIYHIRAFSNDVSGCGGKDCFPDYPKAGYDANGFYITADLFSNVTGNFVEAAIYALPKSKLEAGAGFTYFRFLDPSDGLVVQPSVPAPGEPFSTADNGSEFLMGAPGSPDLSVLAIINTNNIVSSGTTMRLLRTTVKAQSYGIGVVPATQPNVIGPFCKSQGVTSAPSLDADFSKFQATIQKASGNLYGALPFAAKDGTGFPRDVVAWFEVHPILTSSSISASIAHQNYVIPGNGYSIIYPAFGLNKTGAGVMGMTITNKSQSVPGGFPSAAVIQFTGSATTGSIVISGPGVTSDDGFTGCSKKGPGGVGRWGDYGAATVDAKTGFFYTANEMIPDPKKFPRGKFTNWGTFITQLH
jgi:hypothetical protein